MFIQQYKVESKHYKIKIVASKKQNKILNQRTCICFCKKNVLRLNQIYF